MKGLSPMNAQALLFDQLVDESRKRWRTHPQLKRLMLKSAHMAMQGDSTKDYRHKGRHAAIALFMILRSLRIRSAVVGGSVSWRFGGISSNGEPWESRDGFRTPDLTIPTPHCWLITEFGELVDLACSYFHLSLGKAIQSAQQHDVVPMIWMATEDLIALPSVQYEASTNQQTIDMEHCDSETRSIVSRALTYFWGSRVMESFLQKAMVADLAELSDEALTFNDELLLDGPSSIEIHLSRNSWVKRNRASIAPADLPPVTTQAELVAANNAVPDDIGSDFVI